jgi:hypothetical protein
MSEGGTAAKLTARMSQRHKSKMQSHFVTDKNFSFSTLSYNAVWSVSEFMNSRQKQKSL